MAEVLEDFSLSKSENKPKGTIHKVGVIGGGTMGQQIARIISHNGIEVILVDVSEARVQEINQSIEKSLDEIISRWGMTASEKKLILQRITTTVDYNALKACNFIIETVSMKHPGNTLGLRRDLFAKVEAVVSDDTVITSNTSTLMISDVAEGLQRPERAVGLHFIAPVLKVGIVEVVRGRNTSDEAMEMVAKFIRMIRKESILVNEAPGNISSRMMVSLINDACEILMEGVAGVVEVDRVMKEGYGLQFGPFEMADRIGLDTLNKWMDNLYQEFGERKYKTSAVIKRLVRANYMGRQVGQGFYTYDENGRAIESTISCSVIK